MSRTLHPHQYQTLEDLPYSWGGELLSTDVTMTLQYIELCDEGSVILVSATSPSYRFGHGPFDDLNGYYSVDGIVKPLWGGPSNRLQDGIRQFWGSWRYMDPVPNDAKELTVTITNWGDLWGPWEFHVPLD